MNVFRKLKDVFRAEGLLLTDRLNGATVRLVPDGISVWIYSSKDRVARVPLMDYRQIAGIAAQRMYRAAYPVLPPEVKSITWDSGWRSAVVTYIDGTTKLETLAERNKRYKAEMIRQYADNWQIERKKRWVCKVMHDDWCRWRDNMDPIVRKAQSRVLGWYGTVPTALVSNDYRFLDAVAHSNAAVSMLGCVFFPRVHSIILQQVFAPIYRDFAIELHHARIQAEWRAQFPSVLVRMMPLIKVVGDPALYPETAAYLEEHSRVPDLPELELE